MKSRNVPAVVFSIGTREGFFWVPKEQFYRVTEGKDISKQTNKPFEV